MGKCLGEKFCPEGKRFGNNTWFKLDYLRYQTRCFSKADLEGDAKNLEIQKADSPTAEQLVAEYL